MNQDTPNDGNFMPGNDPYAILGVARDASQEEIRRAHRKLAKQYHPDRNKGDENAVKRFKEVQSAYEILSDPKKRENFDRFGHAEPGFPGAGGSGFRPGQGAQRVYSWKAGDGHDIPIDDLDDLFSAFAGGAGGAAGGGRGSIFDDLFGGRAQRGGPQARRSGGARVNADVEHPVQLSFEQAIHGTTLEIARTAPDGQRSTISVKIPPGVRDGQRIRLKGKGNPGGPGQAAGDLFIVCKVAPHRAFRRDGNDIHLDVPLTVAEATLGTKVEIPTIDGPTTLTIPPGTPGGAKLRLKQKGVRPAGQETRGDQYVTVRIVPPKQLTDEQKRLMEQFQSLDTTDPRADMKW